MKTFSFNPRLTQTQEDTCKRNIVRNLSKANIHLADLMYDSHKFTEIQVSRVDKAIGKLEKTRKDLIAINNHQNKIW